MNAAMVNGQEKIQAIVRELTDDFNFFINSYYGSI